MNAIEVKNISLSYGDRDTLKDISFNVKRGHIHGFLGPNGAGKTSTMKVIANLLTPDEGKVLINDQKHDQIKNDFHNQIGFLLEDPPLYKDMSVKEYLTFIAKLKRVHKSKISERLEYCKNVLDLESVFDRSIENLSKGFKQRVGIAQAIIHMPNIVILDEPTVGLDPYSVVEIRNLILNLKHEHTILLSSHLLHEMSLVCDEVTIIADGRVLESGRIEDIENKLSSNNIIKIKTLNTSDDWVEFINEHPSLKLSSMTTNGKDQVNEYIIQASDSHELYALMVEKSVEFKIKLISIEQTQNTLEDIFIKVVEK
jgi:ABC-2 type transport system ATP-binding protein